MQTLALLSQKGGAGKTTLAVHFAGFAAAAGRKTLILDLDPQASAAVWADRRGDRAPDVIAEHPIRLEAAMEAARKAGYQLVVIDTAPHADQAALRAARCAERIVIPCRPAVFDLASLRDALDICALAKRQPVVVLNAAPIRSRVVTESQDEIARLGASVSPHIIRSRVAYQHCLITGGTVGEYEPGGPAANEFAGLFASVFSCEHDSKFLGKDTHAPAIARNLAARGSAS